MKTILVTFVSGIFICLITSKSLITEFEIYSDEFENTSEMNQCDSCGMTEICTIDCEEEILEQEIFEVFEIASTLVPNDIKVYELEEEVNLGFNSENYLPKNFNPYAGMNTIAELEVEAEIVLSSIFNDEPLNVIINIEDIEIFDIEEVVEIGFDSKNCLPADFNPYLGMNTVAELEVEAKIVLTAMLSDVEQEHVISINEIEVYDIEEEVEILANSVY